jgi:hypothetical protein
MGAIIFMFTLTLHNIEEALWLTQWRIENMPNRKRSPHREHFIFAVLGITVLGYLAAGLHLLFPDNLYLELVFIGFVGAMLVNAIAPHLLLTLKFRKYCPGVFTGCLLLIPFNAIILINAAGQHLKIGEIIISTLVIGVFLLIAIPILEAIAKKAIIKP